MRKLTAAYNKFGFNLLRQLSEECGDTNVLFSPISLGVALALLHNGAGGRTQQAIGEALCLDGMDEQEFNESNSLLLSTFDNPGPRVQLMMPIAIWMDRNFSFSPAYQQLTRNVFKADFATVDFKDPLTLNLINGWSREKTNGKIEALIDGGDLSSVIGGILTNAVYFKGLWVAPFDKRMTRKDVFYLSSGKQKDVLLMTQSVTCPYLETDAFEAVSLQYSDRFSMYIFVPDKESSINVFLRNLNEVKVEHWLTQFDDSPIELSLPRFKIKGDYDLKNTLGYLGVEIIFTHEADFTPMGLAHHFISKVMHKAVVEVNEEGTEAAAATAVMLVRSPPKAFVINRPFFFMIRDIKNDTTLFTGVVADPD